MRKMQVLKCSILWPQYWRLSAVIWSNSLSRVSGNSRLPYKFVGISHEFIRQKGVPEKGRVEVVDVDIGVLVAQQDGLLCHQPAPSCKLIASHQIVRPAPSRRRNRKKVTEIEIESVNVSNVKIHSINPIYFSKFDGVDSKRFLIRQNEALPYLIFKFWWSRF